VKTRNGRENYHTYQWKIVGSSSKQGLLGADLFNWGQVTVSVGLIPEVFYSIGVQSTLHLLTNAIDT